MTIQIIKVTKKIISTLLLTGILGALCACDSTNNFGYPSKITFANNGGEKIVQGDDSFYNIEIANYNGDGKSTIPIISGNGNDTLTVNYQWLTIKMKWGETKMILTAEPNTTHKKRTLYVRGSITDDFAEIKVEQQ